QALLTAPRGPRRALDARTARLAAADLLSRRPWTTRELERRLPRRGAPADVAAEALADLVSTRHLVYGAFAAHWVATRRARVDGPGGLRAELGARVIATPLIDAALARDDADALERARAVARRRLPALRRADPARAAPRLRDHLLRRGHDPSVVARV